MGGGSMEKSKQNLNIQSSDVWKKIIFVLGLAFAVFQLYTAGFGSLPTHIQCSIHVGFAIMLTFLLNNGKWSSGIPPLWARIIALMVPLIPIWIVINYERIIMNIADSNAIDMILGVFTILILLESSRRVMGWAFPILAVVVLLYAYFGKYIPGLFGNAGFSGRIIIENLFLGYRGIWGSITNVSATTVAIYIIFGQLLLLSGAGQSFNDISLLISGRRVGGPAKVAVISSALFGTISGSGAANVAVTGSITIPMMKRLGYTSNFAGAVEASASTGGQILPPIMGAGAMIMAELIGVPYATVALAAIIPALLFFLSVFYSVHFTALKNNLQGMPKDQIPKPKDVLTPYKMLNMCAPIIILILFLIQGYSATYAGFLAAVITIAIYLLGDFKFNLLKTRLAALVKALAEAGYALVLLAILSATAQILVSVLSFTGAGVKISSIIMAIGQSNIILSLLLGMLLVILLSIGTPVTAAYLISASVAASALIKLVDNPLAVHLFLFYFAAMSVITPPVCGGVYVAVGISQGDWVKTAFTACRLAIAGFIVPFIFIYNPVLLLQGEPFDIALAAISAIIGIIAMAAATSGYCSPRGAKDLWKSILLGVGAALSIVPGWQTDLIGVLLISIVVLFHYKSRKKLQTMRAQS